MPNASMHEVNWHKCRFYLSYNSSAAVPACFFESTMDFARLGIVFGRPVGVDREIRESARFDVWKTDASARSGDDGQRTQ
jgi:hypothetical protein